MLHPPVWTIVILGFFAGPQNFSVSFLVWLLILSSGTAGFAYAVNQITDIESDRINRKLFFLPDGLISLGEAHRIASTLVVLILAGAFYLGVTFGFLFLIGMLLGVVYSIPPFYGKNRPFIGTLINGFAHGVMPFAAGYLGSGGDIPRSLTLSIPYVLAVMAVFIGTTIPDIPGDSLTGKVTPGVALGARRSKIIIAALVVIALTVALQLHDFPMAVASACSLPFYVFAARSDSETPLFLAVKTSILFLSLAACWKFWPYLIILIVLILITRIYYHRRFKIRYPRLA
jgi:4-hydroxybenzoate polyprenyltransferase